MAYSELTAKDLKALCEERSIKPSRAKADMIADLTARDAADELTRLGQETGQEAVNDVLPASEDDLGPEDEGPVEKPTQRPLEPLEVNYDWWIFEGRFLRRYMRTGPGLDGWEHISHLANVVAIAQDAGFEPYGPPFRKDDPDPTTWVYAVNIRTP
jgi:hypothetical protein